MDKNEAIQVLETIRDIYPKYDISKEKAKMLIPQLKQMDHKLVMEKLSAHVSTCPYPPTIAEIAAYPIENNDHLEKIKSWLIEASKVPDDIKQVFHQQMVRLVKEKASVQISEMLAVPHTEIIFLIKRTQNTEQPFRLPM